MRADGLWGRDDAAARAGERRLRRGVGGPERWWPFKAPSRAGNYVNEQSEVGAELVTSSYGGDKLQKLRALKRRYDPANLFRLNQNITPD
ncbi:MAG: BBE domain-containing protein [Mycobacteriales bacterium]